MLNVTQIINNTVKDFQNNTHKFNYLETIDNRDYISLHTKPLVPLDIKIDCNLFLKEIEKFDRHFQKWGNHTDLPNRFGISLVNADGNFIDNDPINGSLHIWNRDNPGIPLIETDFKIPTPLMDIDSLRSLQIFNNYWCRSNILKWYKDAEFKPHIDTFLPSPWFRLWGTTDSNSMELIFYNADNQPINIDPIESGRIYLINTSLVHYARCVNNTMYQFFLSVSPKAYTKLLQLVL